LYSHRTLFNNSTKYITNLNIWSISMLKNSKNKNLIIALLNDIRSMFRES